MKKILAFLLLSISIDVVAAPTPPVMMEAGLMQSRVPQCWVELNVSTTVDGRQITGFSKEYDDRVAVFVGPANGYNTINVTFKNKDDRDPYIAKLKEKIAACYK